MWKALFETIAGYFRSPNRIQVVELAKKANEVAIGAMNEVRTLRDDNEIIWKQLKTSRDAEQDCKRRLKALEDRVNQAKD